MSGERYLPERKVIPAQELGVVTDASRYVRHAREVLRDAQQHAMHELEKADERGYQAGFQRGREEAFGALQSTINEVRTRLSAAENDLEDVVVAALEKIIGEMGEREAARRALQVALSELTASIAVDIRVPPDELADVQALISALPLQSNQPEIRSVQEDPLLKPGEMLLLTPQGRIHVGLRQQIARLRSTMSSGS